MQIWSCAGGNIQEQWGKLGILEKNEKRYVGRKIVFVPPASVGLVLSGKFVGNDTSSPGATSVTKTREIKGSFTVGHH